MSKCEHEWVYVGISYLTLEEELEKHPGDYTKHTLMIVYECSNCGGERQEHQRVGRNSPAKVEYFSKECKPVHKHWYHRE
ncbi:MAG: hypothetical protein KAS32_17660 [Candidatus Peribacteraceae bacterium]|nr:hypothetical protein [Candidatus Peribacteraceae bacterium]